MKPNIQRLFEAFQTFSLDIQKAGINPTKHRLARERFQTRLEELGIEDKFDWSDESRQR